MAIKLRTFKAALLPAAALLLVGFTSASLKDARYDVSSVSISGPGSIKNGSSANYTVTANISRTTVAQNATIAAPPSIRPSVYTGDTQVGFQDRTIGAGQNAVTGVISLSCVNNEVRGSVAGTGHGNRAVRNWWCFWLCTSEDPAKVKGRLNERSSSEINVLCDP